MRDKIEHKINDIIESILAKDVDAITYSEYKILDCRSKDLRYWEEQAKKTEEMAQLVGKAFGGYGFASPTPAILPEPDVKEE